MAAFSQLIYVGVFSTFLFSIFTANASTATPREEANALLKWKDSLQSESHSLLSSWTLPIGPGHVNFSSHCRSWIGVSCNKAGRIVDVNVSHIGLTGTLISFPFSSLPNLFTLDLSSNHLSGAIPAHIANLSQLNFMSLSYNNFVGEVPSEIRQLASLQDLSLNDNSFTGFIPSGLCNLTNLVSLNLSTNHFSGTLPSEMTNLKSLEYLSVSRNNLQGPIPSLLSNLTKLTALYLDNNQFSGPIPSSIFSLGSLTRLYLPNNRVSGSIPSSIGKLTKLVVFCAQNNKLSGSIPREMVNLRSLKVLALMINQFSGVIPQELSQLKRLTVVTLDENKFSGALPDFCHGGVLQSFSASHNNFSGPVPESMKNCPTLIRVRLERNKLTGNISEVFGVYPTLKYIDLSFNKLYGEISDNWKECKNLTNFKLSTNNIIGRIPLGFGGMTQLGRLDISSNHLRGEVPSDLGKLSSLLYLNLSMNQLSGNLSSEIGSLKSLTTLDLSANYLSGTIPKEIGDCSQLLYLDFSKNNFSGRIPVQIGNLVHLQMLLDFSQNMFAQEIPSELSKLHSLEKLNLSRNMLSGFIPSSLEDMGSLMFIDVSYNALDGPVPNNKAFRDASAENFRNNRGLCGSNSIRALHPCILPKINNGQGGRTRLTVHILVPCLIGPYLLVLAFLGGYFACYKKRRESVEGRRKTGNGDLFGIWHYNGKIVYEDIIQATEGFSYKYCIGNGGSGSVYKAKLSTGQVVAVKKFHQPIENQVDNLKSFEAEVRSLLELKHRNIVKLYGFCSHVLHSFIVYEYLERGSLADILSNAEEAASLDWTKRINIIKGIAKALCHMHHGCSSPIIHRDISSKNILLNADYDAYLADFGFTRVLEQSSSNWTTVAGTFGYLAPEFAYTMKLTEKCDVYSFGMLTLEVLMGIHPGEFVSLVIGTTSTESRIKMLMDKLDKRLPPPASSIDKELLKISELAFECLNNNPGSRPTLRLFL